MGRTPIKTDRERERRKRATQEKSNAKRREQYLMDKKYREARRRASRDGYREAVGGFDFTKYNSCQRSLESPDAIGKVRGGRQLVSISEMAKAMGFSNKVTIYYWQRDGKFPKPSTKVAGGNRLSYYTHPQAVRILGIMMDHFEKSTYLKTKDADTISSLMAVMQDQK